MAWIEFLLIIITSWALAYFNTSRWVWGLSLAILLTAIGIWGNLSAWLWLPITTFYLFIAVLINVSILRLKYITHPLMQLVNHALPTMSDTEREALEAGDVWWESEIFSGKPNWKYLESIQQAKLTKEEQAFLDKQVNTLCGMISDWEINENESNSFKPIMAYLKKEGFFGMVIPKNFGGHGFSALLHSTVVSILGSRSPSVAVTAMVPNSLGPGELLMHYGTDEQKKYYLPRLAKGEEIPCFALTAPEAGSDATAMQDKGVVCRGKHEGKEIIGIRLNWNKRYITLAPIATLVGIAFKLYDPEHLIGEKDFIGITLCLIPSTHPGVEIGRRHRPAGMVFMNGPTTGEDVFIPMEWVIGGEAMLGQGWRMLVECLSIGRAISLPALGAATGKLCYRMTGAYAFLRKQFKISIGKFEGVEEAMARIAGLTYIMDASRLMTANAVDQGIKPSVASAIAKYHLTEMARTIVNDAMDIHGGRGIQIGPRNYLWPAYIAIPISITVEGANILTRNLMIFGQGALRCHPYTFHEIHALQNNDEKKFDQLLLGHIGFMVSNFSRTIGLSITAGRCAGLIKKGPTNYYFQQLTRMSAALAFVSDLSMALLGGKLKRKERLSARLGDVLSYLYMASSVLKYFHDRGAPEDELDHVHWSLQHCLYKVQIAFDEIFDNFPTAFLGLIIKRCVFPYGRAYKAPSDKLDSRLAEAMMLPSALRDKITQHCFIGNNADDITGRMENALLKAFSAIPVEQKLEQAIRQAIIPRDISFEEKIAIAKKKKILNKKEITMLCEAEEARKDAILVDDFNYTLGKEQACPQKNIA